MADQLHTLYVDFFPTHYTLRDLSDLLTLPGHSPPVALRSIYAHRRQVEENFGKRTKFAFVAFESVKTKKAVIQKFDGFNVEGQWDYRLRVADSTYASSGWQWNSFSVQYKEEYEICRGRARSPPGPSFPRPPITRSLHDTREYSGASTSGSVVPRRTLETDQTIYVPQALMLEFPEIYIEELPLDTSLATPRNLLQQFS